MLSKKTLAPNILTVMNMFLGFYAVILAANENFVPASWLIILAGVFDVFDGKVARATKAYSSFGEILDSLADVISFGFAPSFLIYQVHLNKMGPAGLIISFFPLLFGAMRLARFNAELSGTEKQNFSGLPIPAAAGFLAAFIIFNFHIWDELWIPSLMLPLVIATSLLMVSTIEFDAMPKFNFSSGPENSRLFALVITSVALLALFPQLALFPIAVIYVGYSIARGIAKIGREDGSDDNGVAARKGVLRRKRNKAEAVDKSGKKGETQEDDASIPGESPDKA